MSHLTIAQLTALENFRTLYGQRWRRELQSAWAKGAEYQYPHGALLRQLRNNFGPDWLEAYRPGDTQVGYLRQVVSAGPTARWEIESCDGGVLHEDFLTKTEARRTAKLNKITLIERRSV